MKAKVKSTSGQVGISRLVGVAIALAVGGLLFASLLPTAINDLSGASLDGNNTTESTRTLFDLLPLFLVLAALMVFVKLVE